MRRPARQPDDRNGSDKYQQIPGESPLMHDRHEPDAGQRTHRKATSPSSSRMIATYLTDIEQMLDEERWDAALREASDLPRIAVALPTRDCVPRASRLSTGARSGCSCPVRSARPAAPITSVWSAG